jgi:hypothetical protein
MEMCLARLSLAKYLEKYSIGQVEVNVDNYHSLQGLMEVKKLLFPCCRIN